MWRSALLSCSRSITEPRKEKPVEWRSPGPGQPIGGPLVASVSSSHIAVFQTAQTRQKNTSFVLLFCSQSIFRFRELQGVGFQPKRWPRRNDSRWATKCSSGSTLLSYEDTKLPFAPAQETLYLPVPRRTSRSKGNSGFHPCSGASRVCILTLRDGGVRTCNGFGRWYYRRNSVVLLATRVLTGLTTLRIRTAALCGSCLQSQLQPTGRHMREVQSRSN